MLRITVETDPRSDDVRVVEQGIVRFNIERCGMTWQPLAVLLRNESGGVVGGLVGHTEWGWLYCSLLWIPEELRGQDWGSKLLQAAEDEARKRGCLNVHLDTFGFQAKGFYEKHGYSVFGVLEGYPNGYDRYYLRKSL